MPTSYNRNVNADPAFGFRHSVELGCIADVSEEYITSIIRADGYQVLIQPWTAQTIPT